MKNLFNNKTKIVCTIGPSSDSYKTLCDMAINGMDIARINMSHGDPTYYKQNISNIRKIPSKKVLVMTDTKGPEIRVCKLNKPLDIKANSIVTIKTIGTINKPNSFAVYDSTGTYNMAKDVKVNDQILVDDGKLCLIAKTVDIKKGVITAKALNTHTIITNKRINLPNGQYTMPFLSQKDIDSLKLTAELKADMVALSFVNTTQNIKDVRKILNKCKNGKKVKIIAKIETQQALNNIKAIIKEADGVMVARGDLGLETPFYNIPYWELEIIKLARKAKKFVIVATQMLDSLEHNLTPTRAEVTDVYFAVVNGANATMLSGETASGLYPVNAVNVMAKINEATEKRLKK